MNCLSVFDLLWVGSISIKHASVMYQFIYAERSLVVSELRSKTKRSQFESGCLLSAEVSFLQ